MYAAGDGRRLPVVYSCLQRVLGLLRGYQSKKA
jgi:hypothetical protein